ncbi:MAG: hypothetical protein ACE5JN_07985 [Candidatus Methylomirabilia bacterium]
MGKDDYYARVQELTEEALERLSLLSPSLTDFILHYWTEIQQAANGQLCDEERTSLTNLSFFYFLGTCIDFLFLLHLRHRHVNIYQHELEHILSVMMTHAKTQQDSFAEDHAHGGSEARLHEAGQPHDTPTPFNLLEFEASVRRLKARPGNDS